MSKKTNYVAGPHGDKWQVKAERSSRASSIHSTQKEAIDAARHLAKQHDGESKIQGRNGQFRASDSHGHDPRSTKG